ncbi:MAG TPA: hypothetical protein VMT11_06090 [Myxococcaceae bacterium]|nr:hypothetical protein [Myxococcaceae bacterium]
MPTLAPEMTRAWAAGFFLMWTACAPAGHGNRPPAPEPPPSPGMISTLGFDQAVRMGSDYVKQSSGVGEAALLSSQELPAGMLQLTFDLGPGRFPVRVTVDRVNGRVTSMEPVEQVPGVTQPAR